MTPEQAIALFRHYAACSRLGWYGEAQRLLRQLKANHFCILIDHRGLAGMLAFDSPAMMDYQTTVEWRV